MELTNNQKWRVAVLVVLVFGSLAAILSMSPIPQDPDYHNFADTRTIIGIPNFWNVMSNLPFALVGLLGLYLCKDQLISNMPRAWVTFFIAVALVSLGSAYYHWQPSSETLVWDRLPMTIGFMGLFVGIVGEYVSEDFAKRILFPMIVIGIASVVYWHFTDDLRFYAWVQFMPLLVLPLILLLFKSPYYKTTSCLVMALVWYLLAKVFEAYDEPFYLLVNQVISGHSIKHVAAAVGCFNIFLMLNKRIEN